MRDIYPDCPRMVGVDCTASGVLVLAMESCQIYSLDPRTGTMCAIIGKEYDRPDSGSVWERRDGGSDTAQFECPREIVLCDDDRSVVVLDGRSDFDKLRFVSLVELDQSMFVDPFLIDLSEDS